MKKLLILLLFISCSYNAKIKQTIEVDSIIDNTYNINTYVNIYEGIYYYCTEYHIFEYGVGKEYLNMVAEYQMSNAIQAKKEIDVLLTNR